MVGRRPCAPVRLPSANPAAKQHLGQQLGQQRDGSHEDPEEEVRG
jgi:hypothetical protein